MLGLGPDDGALGHDALHAHELADVLRVEAARGDLVCAEAALHADAELAALGPALQRVDVLRQRGLERSEELQGSLQEAHCGIYVVDTQVVQAHNQASLAGVQHRLDLGRVDGLVVLLGREMK